MDSYFRTIRSEIFIGCFSIYGYETRQWVLEIPIGIVCTAICNTSRYAKIFFVTFITFEKNMYFCTMFSSITKIVLSSVFSLLILLSGMNISVKRHVCLHSYSRNSIEKTDDCCLKNASESNDNPKSCCSQKEEKSCESSDENSCCDTKNWYSFLNFSTDDNVCQSNFCLFVEAFIEGKKIEQHAVSETKIQPLFQITAHKPFHFLEFVSLSPPQNRFEKNKKLLRSTSLFVLFRVFRI